MGRPSPLLYSLYGIPGVLGSIPIPTPPSSNDVTPLPRTYPIPNEAPLLLQKSLYDSSRLEVPPPPPRSVQVTRSRDQDVRPEITPDTNPEPVLLDPLANRRPKVAKEVLNRFPWPLDLRKLAPRLNPRRPECRALLISNNEPLGHEDRLRFPEADVERVKKCLITSGVENGKIQTVKVEGNKCVVRKALSQFFSGVISGDILILFISAHAGYGDDGLVHFMDCNAEYFSICINNLPSGCHLEMLFETCYSTELARLKYPIKQMPVKNVGISMPSSILMGIPFAVAEASPPSPAKHTTLPGTQSHRFPSEDRSYRRASAVDPLAESTFTARPPHSFKRPGGPEHGVVQGSSSPDFMLGENTKATVTLWAASVGFAYESYEFPGEAARNSVAVNAFCTAIEMGIRTRSAIWDVIECMTTRENNARAKRDLSKSPKELAELTKDGPRDQCPHLRSTCSDENRVLQGEIFRALPGAYVP